MQPVAHDNQATAGEALAKERHISSSQRSSKSSSSSHQRPPAASSSSSSHQRASASSSPSSSSSVIVVLVGSRSGCCSSFIAVNVGGRCVSAARPHDVERVPRSGDSTGCRGVVPFIEHALFSMASNSRAENLRRGWSLNTEAWVRGPRPEALRAVHHR